jgi:uncharacterized protein (TIGR01244 family)
MWPFSKPDPDHLPHRKVDGNFAIAGQLQPEQMPALAAAGFRTVLCARPDHEDPGQPSYAQIEAAAKAAGLASVHIPVSGRLTEGALIRMQEALANLPGPILGYCRSGARAGSLYAAIRQ